MGFFHVIPETAKAKQQSKALSVSTVERLGCSACTLDKAKLKNSKATPIGAEHPLLYFLTTMPDEDDEDEDRHGTLAIKARVPSKYKNNIRWNNVIRCHTPGDQTPTDHEIACCRKLQVHDIATSKPKALISFGPTALHWFLGDSRIQTLWRGRRLAMSIGGHNFWLYPTLHPAFVRRQREEYGGDDWIKAFDKDLQRVFNDADTGFDEPPIWTPGQAKANIHMLRGPAGDWPGVIKLWIRQHPEFGFDYETNTLDPQETKAKILTAALGNDQVVLTFPIGHREAAISPWQQKILLKTLAEELPKAKKVVAHNAKFEQLFSLKFLGEGPTRAIKWADSMAKAYTLHEQQGNKDLDDQTLIYHGIRIKSLSTLDVKHLDDEPLGEVLVYNGMDARF